MAAYCCLLSRQQGDSQELERLETKYETVVVLGEGLRFLMLPQGQHGGPMQPAYGVRSNREVRVSSPTRQGQQTCHEIVDGKEIEQRLQASEVRARRLFDSNIIGVFHAGIDGTIFDANEAFLKIVDYQREDLAAGSLNWRTLTPPAHQDITERVVAEVKATGTCVPFEKEYFRKDGSRVAVLQGVTTLPGTDEAIVFVVDMTERKLGAETLRQSEERLKLVLEASDTGWWHWDLRSNAFVSDAKCQAILGLSSAAEANNGVETFTRNRIYLDDQKRFMDLVTQAMQVPGDYEGEFRIVRPNGHLHWFLAKGRSFSDDAGTPVRITGVVMDLNKHKQVEEQLRALNETLEQRVAARTAEAEQRATQLRVLAAELTLTEQRERRRLAQILHDHLQQLLVAARLKIDRLRRRLQNDTLRQFAEQADQLINESLAASRSLTVELSTPVLYDAGLAAALEWLARQIEEKHGLAVEVQADQGAEPAAEDVRVLLFQAVRELLFNVVKHAQADKAQVRLAALDDEHLQIVVGDSGVGFDPATLAAARGPNGGFGLFSLHERLELIGARLEIQSAPGEGCWVTIVAPWHRGEEVVRVSDPVAVAPELAPPATQRPVREGTQKIRVLLADDHPVLRMGLVELLKQEPDIEVVGEAADGQAAVDLSVRVEPDVVLMDVTMPIVDGVEATRQLAARLPQVRVIGLSMHEEEDLAAAMRAAGAVAYMSKSGPTSAVLAAIRRSAWATERRG